MIPAQRSSITSVTALALGAVAAEIRGKAEDGVLLGRDAGLELAVVKECDVAEG